MTLYEVLRRHGIKTGIITAVIVVIVVIVAVTCLTRKPEKETKNPTDSKTITASNSGANKAGAVTPKNKFRGDDDFSGSSKLFKGFKYVGNSESKVYHVTDGSCQVADRINPKHIVRLDSKDKARRLGYERCESCKP